MKTKQVEIDGITYKVSATTERGVEEGIANLKKALKPAKPKRKKKSDDDKNTEPEHV